MQTFDPPRGFLGVFAAVERGEPKEIFVLRAEAAAGSDNDIQLAHVIVDLVSLKRANNVIGAKPR
jgi:hypothetical protein